MSIDTVKSSAGYGANPAGRPADDFYRTPRIAVDKLLEFEKFDGAILEPACGDGAISDVLMEHGYAVASTDLYDYQYGHSGVDFLTRSDPWENVVTNPPFKFAQQFIEKGLELTKPFDGKLALLLRLSFLEGQKRKVLFEGSPLKAVYVFSKRLTFTRPGDEGKGYSGMMAYSWMVWDWKYEGEPVIRWL